MLIVYVYSLCRRRGKIKTSLQNLLSREQVSRWPRTLFFWIIRSPRHSRRRIGTSLCNPNSRLSRYVSIRSPRGFHSLMSLGFLQANARNAPTPPPAPTPIIPVETKANPYASGSVTAVESGFEGAPKERHGRNFRFNPKGKYVQLGNQMRQEAQLEELKQRIAESAKKAGIADEFETLEKNIRVRLSNVTCSICTNSNTRSAMRRLLLNGGTPRCYQTSPTTISRWAFPK